LTENQILLKDCREGIDLIPDNSVDIVLTDPPFGVAFKSNSSTTPEGKAWAKPIANDNDLGQAIELFDVAMRKLLATKAKDELECYIFTKWSVLPEWMTCVRALPDLEMKMLLVWDKSEPGMGDLEGNWGCGHEMIIYCKRGRKPVQRRRGAVLGFLKTPPIHAIHPTEKPVGLLAELLGMSGNPGDTVVDLFSGSGSTSVAAQKMGMNSWAFEVDPDHHRRSLERLSQRSMF
jgi:site-specific DNA-methyltransferase (adenine-specific)